MIRLLLLACLLPALLFPGRTRAQDKVLNVYNWTDYIDPAALERFHTETGITVHYDVYDSLETLEAKMLTGHSGYDVIVPTAEPALSRLIGSGALRPLDKAAIPNLSGLDPALMGRLAVSDPGNTYAAIYLWGTTGLGEVPSKIKALAPDAPLGNWDVLFKPEWAKKIAPCGITMMDSPTDMIPSVLRYLHHSPDSTDPKDLAEVERTLMAIRPYVRTFASAGALEALAAGETCLVFDYSGDVIQASIRAAEAKRDPVAYVAPPDFTQLWFDTLAVPKDAPHPELAMQFINFLLQPGVMAGITNTVHYANAVPASRGTVAASIRDDPNVYPSAQALDHSFTVKALDGAVTRARTRLWARFKAGR